MWCEYEGRPPKTGIYLLKMCIYSFMFKLQSPSKYFHLMQYTYQDIFSTAPNSFWTLWFWCFLVLLPFFVSPLPHRESVSLWGLFNWGQNKSCPGRGWMHRDGRAWGLCHFWSNTSEHSVRCGQVLCNSPLWNGQTCGVSSKQIHWNLTQPLTTTPASTLL